MIKCQIEHRNFWDGLLVAVSFLARLILGRSGDPAVRLGLGLAIGTGACGFGQLLLNVGLMMLAGGSNPSAHSVVELLLLAISIAVFAIAIGAISLDGAGLLLGRINRSALEADDS